MQPGQIRVFDGLRVTTEHVTHLQGAVHSALRDIRSIIGPGIFRGFDVGIVNGSAVIQPGLGIDYEGNRVVRDDPISVPIEPLRNGDARFVCLRYQQVANGEVEGRPTLIWDSAEPVLTQAPPGEGDNLLVLARLLGGENGFIVVEPATPPAPAEPAVSDAQVGSHHVTQGVVRIAQPVDAPDHLLSQLIAALRRTPVPPEGFTVDLTSREVQVPFDPVSITFQVLIDLTVTPVTVEATAPAALWFQSRCTGEATIAADGVMQSGMCSVYDASPSAYGAHGCSEIVADAIGALALAKAAPAESSPIVLLSPLRLAVRIEAGGVAGGFVIRCVAGWSGAGGETAANAIEAALATTRLEIVMAWKAQGGLVPARV